MIRVAWDNSLTLTTQAVDMLKKVLTDGKENMLQVLQSKIQGSGYSKASVLQFDDSKFPPPNLSSKKISVWDPTTGKSFLVAHDSDTLPPINVGCLFNSTNVWVNIQKYDFITRVNWNLDKLCDWFPFLDEDIKEACGPIQCWYSEPAQLSEILLEDPEATPKLVKDIAASMQHYRNNLLGITDSSFFAPICKILQESTKKLEAQLQQEQHNKALHNKLDMASLVESEILAVLPDHHSWFGRPFHFSHTEVDDIMQQIVWTGILDCTVPQALYGIGAQVFDYSWGLKSVWVYVGYCTDLFNSTQ